MKKLFYITIALLCLSCSSENALDCFQAAGDKVAESFSVEPFSRIQIEDDVILIIREGDTQSVLIETGENLLNDVVVKLEGETLVIKDNNSCNLVRAYGTTKAIVTTPVLTAIRNSSAYNVLGEGILNFPSLSLVSNSNPGPENIRKSGDFYLNINCEELTVSANGSSVFYITGTAQKVTLSFEDELPRFEGEDFLINDLTVFQRSANKMIVNPQESIKGKIMATGDIISVNEPLIVDVKEFFTGRLIFQD